MTTFRQAPLIVLAALCACAAPQQRSYSTGGGGEPAPLAKLPKPGKPVDAPVDALGWTALMAASAHGQLEMMQVLLDRGASIDAAGPGGVTALMLASKAGKAEAVGELLRRGASVGMRDSLGHTALAGAAGGARPPLEEAERVKAGPTLAEAARALEGGQGERALALYAGALGTVTRNTALEAEVRGAALKAAAALAEPPAMPEAAREHAVKAQLLLKRGGSEARAAEELQAAVDIAPWWADGYYNLGLVRGAEGRTKEAIAALKLFIASAPDAERAQAAQDKIYEFELAQEQADRTAGLAGTWIRAGGQDTFQVSLRGSTLVAASRTPAFPVLTMQVSDDRLQGRAEGAPYPGGDNCTIPGQTHPATGRIAPDGKSIEFEFAWSSYQTHSHCVNMMGVPSNCCLLCDKVCDGANVISTSNWALRLVRP